MASDPRTIETLLACLNDAVPIRAKPMFGEYGIYAGDCFVGVVCSDRFHLKPTKAGLAFAPELALAPAYPGAKPSIVVPAERWDETEWMAELLKITVANLPASKKPKLNRPGFTGGQNSRRIARYGTDIKEEDREAVFT